MNCHYVSIITERSTVNLEINVFPAITNLCAQISILRIGT